MTPAAGSGPAGIVIPFPSPLPPPNITPLFTRLLEEEAARRGLPPEPWTA